MYVLDTAHLAPPGDEFFAGEGVAFIAEQAQRDLPP